MARCRERDGGQFGQRGGADTCACARKEVQVEGILVPAHFSKFEPAMLLLSCCVPFARCSIRAAFPFVIEREKKRKRI